MFMCCALSPDRLQKDAIVLPPDLQRPGEELQLIDALWLTYSKSHQNIVSFHSCVMCEASKACQTLGMCLPKLAR